VHAAGSGSLGEAPALLILAGGVYLAARRMLNWRIPVAVLLSAALVAGALHYAAPARYPAPMFMLLSGGLLLGAVYMATDPVGAPVTARGMWLYGGFIGVVTLVIRLFGGLPEGVMYAILLGNALAPHLDAVTQPRAYGTPVRREEP
jgi:electron transport complex protein RnfD